MILPPWFLLLAALMLQACAYIERDPRGEWGYFENGRSIGETSAPGRGLR